MSRKALFLLKNSLKSGN